MEAYGVYGMNLDGVVCPAFFSEYCYFHVILTLESWYVDLQLDFDGFCYTELCNLKT